MDSNLKIFCVFHDTNLWPEIIDRINGDENIVPLKCGCKDHETGKLNNVLFDDDGDNISELNPFINEITGIYWIWKHLEEIGSPEHIGICHYRRFFRNEDILNYRNYDIINISNKRIFPMSIYQQYCSNKNHDRELLEYLSVEASKKTGVNVMDYFSNRFNLFKMCNMFIMKRDLFKQYGAFIDSMVKIAYEHVNPFETLKDKSFEYKRTISFALERMSSFWMDFVSLLRRCQMKTLLNIEYFKVKPW